MTPDSELLRQFARTNSEAAFAELVKRRVNLVYSAALRQVNGDAHSAKEVAQNKAAKTPRPFTRRFYSTGVRQKVVRGATVGKGIGDEIAPAGAKELCNRRTVCLSPLPGLWNFCLIEPTVLP
jgi:hypothetical protein